MNPPIKPAPLQFPHNISLLPLQSQQVAPALNRPLKWSTEFTPLPLHCEQRTIPLPSQSLQSMLFRFGGVAPSEAFDRTEKRFLGCPGKRLCSTLTLVWSKCFAWGTLVAGSCCFCLNGLSGCETRRLRVPVNAEDGATAMITVMFVLAGGRLWGLWRFSR